MISLKETLQVLRDVGNFPDFSERLTICTRNGKSKGRHCLSKGIGLGSSSHEELLDVCIIDSNSVSVHRPKQESRDSHDFRQGLPCRGLEGDAGCHDCRSSMTDISAPFDPDQRTSIRPLINMSFEAVH